MRQGNWSADLGHNRLSQLVGMFGQLLLQLTQAADPEWVVRRPRCLVESLASRGHSRVNAGTPCSADVPMTASVAGLVFS